MLILTLESNILQKFNFLTTTTLQKV